MGQLLLRHLPRLLATAVIFVSGAASAGWTREVPAVYVFGDSLVDVGNNNYLKVNDSKANFPFYGIDFPWSRPTGRFSNGYNAADFFARHMGFRRSPPAYLFLVDNQHNRTYHKLINTVFNKGLVGANFASSGSGILNSTGDTITFSEQIQHFAELKARIQATVNTSDVAVLLSESIFIICSGSNDVFAFLRQNGLALNSTAVNQFVISVISNYSSHLQNLYGLGARRFAVVGVPAIGCVPAAHAASTTSGCVDGMNQLAKAMNDALAATLAEHGSSLQGFKYSLGDAWQLVLDLVAHPADGGFTDVADACCGSGRFNGEVPCGPNTSCCTDRSRHLFWDYLHPTQAAAELVGQAFYAVGGKYTAPISFRQLVQKK